MKKIQLTLIAFLLLGGVSLIAQEKTRQSPPAKAEGKIGDAQIVIDYSSPAVKGRKVYGELEKYDKVWRAGANEATTFENSADIKINGKNLPAGKYAFFVIPRNDQDWIVIFNSNPKQWGAYKHNEDEDVLRVEAKTMDIEHTERLKYTVGENQVHLDWSTTRLYFDVE